MTGKAFVGEEGSGEVEFERGSSKFLPSRQAGAKLVICLARIHRTKESPALLKGLIITQRGKRYWGTMACSNLSIAFHGML